MRQTDRQTDGWTQTNSLTPYTEVSGFFLKVKFVTSLLARRGTRQVSILQRTTVTKFQKEFKQICKSFEMLLNILFS